MHLKTNPENDGQDAKHPIYMLASFN